MDEKVRELLKQRQQIQEEADMAMAAFKSAKGSLAEIDEEILASMKADGASKLIDDTGKIYKISKTTERLFNDEGMLSLIGRVPDVLMNKAHKAETIHKWPWVGVKELLTLGGDIKTTIEDNMVVNIKEKLEIVKQKGGNENVIVSESNPAQG